MAQAKTEVSTYSTYCTVQYVTPFSGLRGQKRTWGNLVKLSKMITNMLFRDSLPMLCKVVSANVLRSLVDQTQSSELRRNRLPERLRVYRTVY